LAVFSFGAYTKTAVIVLLKVLSMSPVTAFIMPVLIWGLVLIRREDLLRLAGTAPLPALNGQAVKGRKGALQP